MGRFDVKAVFFFFFPHCQGALRNLVIWLPKYCSRLLWLGRGVRLDCNLYLYQSLFVLEIVQSCSKIACTGQQGEVSCSFCPVVSRVSTCSPHMPIVTIMRLGAWLIDTCRANNFLFKSLAQGFIDYLGPCRRTSIKRHPNAQVISGYPTYRLGYGLPITC